jgi:hypothetical protein
MSVIIHKDGSKSPQLNSMRGYRKICVTCGLVMEDIENGYGSWYHKDTGKCVHDRQNVQKGARWAKRFVQKRERRTHNRAVKTARKFRP